MHMFNILLFLYSSKLKIASRTLQIFKYNSGCYLHIRFMKIYNRIKFMCLGMSNNIPARTEKSSNQKTLFGVVSTALDRKSQEMFA